jgi:hypothetical protein
MACISTVGMHRVGWPDASPQWVSAGAILRVGSTSLGLHLIYAHPTAAMVYYASSQAVYNYFIT